MSSIRTSLFACVASLALGALAMNQTGSVAAEPQSEGLYELRTYTAAEGKLEALEARFKNHTVKLFEKHGMTNVVYWNVLKGQKGDDTRLVYLLAHKSEDAAKKSWADFRNDPEWMKAKGESEKDGSLTAPKGVVSVYMKATEWSPKGIR